jgi:phage terminase small subunit
VRGRPRIPTNVHELRGTLPKVEIERRRAEEIHARPLRPVKPADLTRFEAECWDLHAAELDHLGLLSVLDAGSFRLACAAYALAVECLEAMRPAKGDGTPDRRRRSLDVVIPDKKYGGVKRHPALGTHLAAAREYRAWCTSFGLVPAARLVLRPGTLGAAERRPDDDDDAFDFG